MSVVGRCKILMCQRLILLACVPACRAAETDALQVLVGAASLDLEIIRRVYCFQNQELTATSSTRLIIY